MNAKSFLDRRQFLQATIGGCGFCAGGLHSQLKLAAAQTQSGVYAPQRLHHPARAKQLIIVFLTGGFSHVETFDYKPQLNADHGKTAMYRGNAQKIMGSQFRFDPYGQSGLMMSELFSNLGSVADELCMIRTMKTDIVEHFQATLAMHTGSATIPMPSIGGWLSYGLGTLNKNLPAYTVFCELLPYAGAQNWDSLFLPPIHQGVHLLPGDDPIPNLNPLARSTTLAELQQKMLHDVNQMHWKQRQHDAQLIARDQTNQVARGMMRVAPGVLNANQETASTLQMYGVEAGDTRSFAWQCLAARRLVERGVRVVEIIESGSHSNWDSHANMQEHVPKAERVDKPVAALSSDLNQRGMLDETLIAICTEFGRTPVTFNSTGREHHADAFSCLLAGGGIQGGITYGETDPYGISTVDKPCHVHDYHATILHLMGIDHERLTYRYAGRDFRLTDVHGNVMKEIII